MQAYRQAAHDALNQLETIVRGMEYFGSKPGTPVEECLKVVQSCKVYVGLFGMRYGSIPDGQDRSMTHIEYDEAQRLSLPSLIYVIDEENQPVLPKHVETGAGAEKLADLKNILKKNHMVSFFTSPQDLRARILHDVPELLRTLGTELPTQLNNPLTLEDNEVLSNFAKLPKMFSGREVTVEFQALKTYSPAIPEACKALGLEIGATVYGHTRIANGTTFFIFAERELAFTLLQIPPDTTIQARAVTAFGAYQRVEWTEEDGPIATPDTETGLVLTKLILEPPSA
jgi:hypothetical protein